MSKMSDFFKTASGAAIRAAVLGGMTMTAAHAGSGYDGPVFDERTGFEATAADKVRAMEEEKNALRDMVMELDTRVAHCDLVTEKLGYALGGMQAVGNSGALSAREKLATIGKLASDVLNDPIAYSDFANPGAQPTGSVYTDVSSDGFQVFFDRQPHVEIDGNDLMPSAAHVLDRYSDLVGALQEDLDVCVDAVATMMDGYARMAVADPEAVANPEEVVQISLSKAVGAFYGYMDYIDHVRAEAEIAPESADAADEVGEVSYGMSL